MKAKTITLTSLVPVKASGKTEFIIAECSYGDFRKLFKANLDFVLTGTASIKDGEVTYDENADKLCRHVKFDGLKDGAADFNYEAKGLKSHDGYIVCEEKNIVTLTKALQTFFNNESVKSLGLALPFELLHTCKQFMKDVSEKPTAKDFINELVPDKKA